MSKTPRTPNFTKTQAPRTLTVTETHQLLNAFVPKEGSHKQFVQGIRNKCMAMIMLEAGLRVGELVGLTMSDLWYMSTPVETIIVNRDIAKNGKERQIPVSTLLKETISQTWVHYWGACNTLESCPAFHGTHRNGGITTRQVERIIGSVAQKTIGRWITPHTLRHTFASKLMRKTNSRIVQELLGHESLTSTQVYTHPNGDDLKKAINCEM